MRGRQETKLRQGDQGAGQWGCLPGSGQGSWCMMGRSPSDAPQLWSDVDTVAGPCAGPEREMRQTGYGLGARLI